MAKPKIVVDPAPRTVDLIFTAPAQARLRELADLKVFRPDRSEAEIDAALSDAEVLIGQTDLSRERLERAPRLRAVFNVEGNLLPNIDYDACYARRIRVLVASPAFAGAVAEVALAFAIDLAREISMADRLFREGKETYGLESNESARLFTGSRVGIIGFGDLGRSLRQLLYPFRCPVMVYDPWMPERLLREHDCVPTPLNALLSDAATVFVFASATAENKGFLGAAEFARMRAGSSLILLSRAAVVDFGALTAAAASGYLKVATDVFPEEPLPRNHPIRTLSNVLLSAHRSGGIQDAFNEIGELVLSDMQLILQGLPPLSCRQAQPETVARSRSQPVTKS